MICLQKFMDLLSTIAQVQYPPLVIGIQLSWAVFQKLASTIGLESKSEILEDLVQVS